LSVDKAVIYVDASGQIAGRLCSKISKLLLHGKRIVVVNAEKALISGKRESVINEWKQKLEISSRVNPIHGPIHYRRPDNILRRMIRGMVPYKEGKGRSAMKRLRVYIGVPESFLRLKLEKFEDASAPRPVPLYTTISEVARNLGWNG
jgi:large subunit ribosomal protein L13